eukprot:TRINITY_DN13780_c0_g1_i4.p1 TRINITY_DN13780_c0_g1~~TRINITY_DN13780_c0_g1_i4.p1  ORF type:complete len:246 (+),score=38.72 TRINITY_DN13780_c0_g1_i4:50-787(+)
MTPWSVSRENSYAFEGDASKIDVLARLPLSKASLFFAQNKSSCGELSRVSQRGGNSGPGGGNASCGVFPSITQTPKKDLSSATDLSGMNAVGKMQEGCLDNGKRWRQRRPPPVKVAKPDMHHLAGFYTEAFVAGTPGRMKQPLQDALEKLTSEELDCTLAVWDSSRRSLHDADKFQEHFETFGAVDWIRACCPRIAPGFALVKMTSAVTIENMLPPSGFRELDGATMFVHKARHLARDVGIELTN